MPIFHASEIINDQLQYYLQSIQNDGKPKSAYEGPFGEISLTKVMIKQDFIKLFFWKLILLTCKRNPVSLVPIPCEVKLSTINYNIICSLFRMMTRL